MSDRKLARHVNVDGTWYGPDDTVPAGVAKRITNPNAWSDGGQTDEPVTPEPTVADPNQEPPRSGKGSGLEAWKAHAVARGFEVPDGASRDDIIAAVDAAKEE